MQRDEYSVCAQPFCEIVHWDGGLWLDDANMSLVFVFGDEAIFHNYVPMSELDEETAAKTIQLFNERLDGVSVATS